MWALVRYNDTLVSASQDLSDELIFIVFFTGLEFTYRKMF